VNASRRGRTIGVSRSTRWTQRGGCTPGRTVTPRRWMAGAEAGGMLNQGRRRSATCGEAWKCTSSGWTRISRAVGKGRAVEWLRDDAFASPETVEQLHRDGAAGTSHISKGPAPQPRYPTRTMFDRSIRVTIIAPLTSSTVALIPRNITFGSATPIWRHARHHRAPGPACWPDLGRHAPGARARPVAPVSDRAISTWLSPCLRGSMSSVTERSSEQAMTGSS
jgi:hypothetical protein